MVIREAPDLRIIDPLLWEAVKQRQAVSRAARDARFGRTGSKLAGDREMTHLLSGLVECGKRGQPFIMSGGGRWRWRWRGKQARHDPCDNGSIASGELERRALSGLRDRLPTPAVVERFAVMRQEELKAAWQQRYGDRKGKEGSLAVIRSQTARGVAQIGAVLVSANIKDDQAHADVLERARALYRRR